MRLNTAKWARKKGLSKLAFVVCNGVLFGIVVTLFSRFCIYLIDIYFFPEDAFLFKPLPTVVGLLSTTAVGLYVSALAWENDQKAEASS